MQYQSFHWRKLTRDLKQQTIQLTIAELLKWANGTDTFYTGKPKFYNSSNFSRADWFIFYQQ